MSRFIKPYLLITILGIVLMPIVSVGAQGETIWPDTPLTVSLEEGGGVDVLYEASRSEIVTITVRSLDFSVDTILSLYDAFGNQLAENDDTLTALSNLSTTDSAIVDFTLPDAGTYTIRVTSFGSLDSGDVEIILTVTGEGSPVVETRVEADNSAKLLFNTEPLKVFLTGDNPVDLVYIAQGPQSISVYSNSLDSNSEELDSVLEILDSEGNSLIENDDLNDDSFNAGIEDFALPSGGTYTVHVRLFDSLQSGGVEVVLVAGDGGNIPVETTTCDSPNLNLGETVDGSISSSGETEFIFCGAIGQVVTITAIATDPPSFTQDLFMSLYDPSGEEIATDDDSATIGQLDPAIESIELPSDGAYRVVITSIDNVAGDFTITLADG